MQCRRSVVILCCGNGFHCYVVISIQHKSGLLSSLPPPEHVTSLTSLVPQSLSRTAAAMKPKTSAPQSAHLNKPTVEPVRTVRQAPSVGFNDSRLSTSSATALSGSVIEDSDEEGVAAVDFFSLDAADKPATYPAAFNSSEAVDVRWSGSKSRLEPVATFMPHDSASVLAASADIVWNATNYTAPATELPSPSDAIMVCTNHVLSNKVSKRLCSSYFVPFGLRLYQIFFWSFLWLKIVD